MKTILIVFPENRYNFGQLSVADDDGVVCFGPVPALGKADNEAAAAHGNPTRDPAKPWGDTPTGQYTGNLRYEPDSPENRHSYGNPDATGKIPVIHLEPIEGNSDAWKRQSAEGIKNDMGLLIHCRADENAVLYATHGCCRLFQDHMTVLLAQVAGLETFPVAISQKEQPV